MQGNTCIRANAGTNVPAFLFFSVIEIHHDIYSCMAKKQKSAINENELYILPSPNGEMRTFISQFKVDVMEHVVSSIKFAIENNRDLVEVFQFSDSPFVVTISKKEFDSNLHLIEEFYSQNQMFELCAKVEELRNKLKLNNDEKENSETDDS